MRDDASIQSTCWHSYRCASALTRGVNAGVVSRMSLRMARNLRL